MIAAGAGFYALRPAPVSAIAVLPFENASGNDDDSHINEGLGTELRRRLMGVPGLRVQARSSSVSVVELGLDPRAIAQRLDVGVTHQRFTEPARQHAERARRSVQRGR